MMQAHRAEHADLADRAALAALATSVGQAPEELFDLAYTTEMKSVYAAEAIERSVFGSPTYFVSCDMFYGQDHLDFFEYALSQPFARKCS